ncbi:active breakpoint cluster region-related protein isoform X1 [Synchiropus splendidus]|uniref:active breakpoint cluster region-related protein isoform X1 n=2 Tax=Synchiropus splendidus TaxID=270530 RepID=UPI00237D436B|nr:active breakpoint cluster region-related protein isoform X1 [Synchiropus splendidus]
MDNLQESAGDLEAQQASVMEQPDVLPGGVQPEPVSPLLTDLLSFPDTPTLCTTEEMLEKRLLLLKGIVKSEEVYLRELETLLMPMKALRAAAGTSKPVLSSHQVQTVFYQVPELREIHQSFYTELKARVIPHCHAEEIPAQTAKRTRHRGFDLTVGDLFQKVMKQIGVYGGFIANYKKAVDVVRKCMQSDPLFRTLAESMMSTNSSEKSQTKYTFEALLYKPLDRVTKTTLVLRELVQTTPPEHSDYQICQEALRLSRSFLVGVNESSQCKREVMLTHDMRRKLVRDGFVVDATEAELRHLFLYTDLLLCTKYKAAAKGKQDQYRFSWYLPLAGLKLRWDSNQQQSHDVVMRLDSVRSKTFLLRQQLQQQTASKCVAARNRKKLEQLELMMFILSPVHRLELHSPSGKSRTLLLSSLTELEEWRESIRKLTKDVVETLPPDLLTMTSACVKLRMAQQPPLVCTRVGTTGMCGTLSVMIHFASGLQEAASVYLFVEVDGYGFYDQHAKTHSSARSLSPHWEQELSFQMDEAQNLQLLCVSHCHGCEDTILGRATLKLNSSAVSPRWRRQTLTLNKVDVTFSLKYTPHQLDPPGTSTQQHPVFCFPLEIVTQHEGVLVPHVVRCCVEEVERRGLDEEGIYRISGNASEINSLRGFFNTNLRDALTRMKSVEINVVSGTLKLYFRELPEPLVPPELFHSLSQALEEKESHSRLDAMLSLLQSCPEPNRHTFLFLLHHLQRVSERQEVNKMSALNLATVFGPSLLRPMVVGGEHDDISQAVAAQVQVIYYYLQCDCLPEAQISVLHDTDVEDETTQM